MARQAYFEHPDYVPLLKAAFTGWDRLAAETGVACLHRVGVLLVADERSEVLVESARAAHAHGIPVQTLDPTALHARYPWLRAPPEMVGLLEPGGGFIDPEAGIRAHLAAAERRGARVNRSCHIERLTTDGQHVLIHRAGDAPIRAARVVLTAGAWTSQLLLGLPDRLPLEVQKHPMVWFRPQIPGTCSPAQMPAWFLEHGAGGYYGVPEWAGQPVSQGVKVGFHGPGPSHNPDHDRDVPEELLRRFAADIERYMPKVFKPPHDAKGCLYTMSRDQHFILSPLPSCPRVVVGCGFSGHGYKFAPVVGEALSDYALDGGTALPIGFLSLKSPRWT